MLLGARADAPAGQPLDQLGRLDLDVQRGRDPGVLARQQPIERLRLGARPGEPVEDGALRGVGLGEALLDDPHRHRVGHQRALLHVAPDLGAERRAVAQRGPEQVARGDVRQAERRCARRLRLGPLAGAGRAEHDEDQRWCGRGSRRPLESPVSLDGPFGAAATVAAGCAGRPVI